MNPHAPVCPCGSLRFQHDLVMFPMHWSSKCANCGHSHLDCSLQVAASRGRWVEGHFDEYSRWIPGRFVK